MSKNQHHEEDLALAKFLDFLAQDMEKNPQHIKAINFDLFSRIQSLTADLEFDINAPLSEEDE
ncbi:MAG: type II toxin-antitoxin system PrlF family antitoxin [Rivularia sp. (in: cyanobacteria)]